MLNVLPEFCSTHPALPGAKPPCSLRHRWQFPGASSASLGPLAFDFLCFPCPHPIQNMRAPQGSVLDPGLSSGCDLPHLVSLSLLPTLSTHDEGPATRPGTQVTKPTTPFVDLVSCPFSLLDICPEALRLDLLPSKTFTRCLTTSFSSFLLHLSFTCQRLFTYLKLRGKNMLSAFPASPGELWCWRCSVSCSASLSTSELRQEAVV